MTAAPAPAEPPHRPDRRPLVAVAQWRLAGSRCDAMRAAAGAGAEAIQLDLGGPGRGAWLDDPGELARTAAGAAECGVRVLAVAGNHLNDLGLVSAPGSRHDAEVRRFVERLLDTALALRAPLVFVPSFRRSAITGAATLAATGVVLAWAAREAAARRLLLASENVLAPEPARALVEQVASPAFRLVLDTLNPVLEGVDPAGLVAGLGPVLADQVHLKDGPPAVGPSPLLGSGDGRVARTLEALTRHDVPVAAFVLENDYRVDGDARLAADVTWARRVAAGWRRSPNPVAPDGGRVARDTR